MAATNNLLMLKPEEIGLISDEKHPLYDPRLKLPFNEGMISSIMQFGVIVPISVIADGETMIVISGLQRVKNAVEANKRLVKDGKEPIKIQATLKKGSDSDLFATAVLSNVDQDDPPLVIAEKLAKYTTMGHTEDEAAVIVGQKVSFVRQHLALLNLARPVQQAVTKGEFSISAAAQLSKLDREQQIEAMNNVTNARGKKTVAQTKKAIKKAKGGKVDDAADAPSKKQMERFGTSGVLDDTNDVDKAILHTLIWVIDGERHGKLAVLLRKFDAATTAAAEAKVEKAKARAERKAAREKAGAKAKKKAKAA